MLPYDQRPVAQREPLTRIIRNRCIERRKGKAPVSPAGALRTEGGGGVGGIVSAKIIYDYQRPIIIIIRLRTFLRLFQCSLPLLSRVLKRNLRGSVFSSKSVKTITRTGS
jgi:hypothetical protein